MATFGVAGLASSRHVGGVADRIGMRRMGFGAGVTLTLAAVALAWASTTAALIACVVVAGVCATGGRVMTSTFALISTPANPNTATALALAA